MASILRHTSNSKDSHYMNDFFIHFTIQFNLQLSAVSKILFVSSKALYVDFRFTVTYCTIPKNDADGFFREVSYSKPLTIFSFYLIGHFVIITPLSIMTPSILSSSSRQYKTNILPLSESKDDKPPTTTQQQPTHEHKPRDDNSQLQQP